MDTILYLCEEKKAPYRLERLWQEDYLLLRAGFDRKLWRELGAGEEAGTRFRRLAAFLLPLAENRDRTAYACSAAVEELLAPVREEWERVFPVPEFREYVHMRWIDALLAQVRVRDVILLGFDPIVPELFRSRGAGWRTLRLILRPEERPEGLSEFLDDFCEETGIAACPEEPGRVLESDRPVCVIDLSERPGIPAARLPRGSVWLDARSLGSRQRILQARMPDVVWLSVKKMWDLTGKERAQP